MKYSYSLRKDEQAIEDAVCYELVRYDADDEYSEDEVVCSCLVYEGLELMGDDAHLGARYVDQIETEAGFEGKGHATRLLKALNKKWTLYTDPINQRCLNIVKRLGGVLQEDKETGYANSLGLYKID